ncbi:Bug family tripartite tricarboxylate transporter substrate binding protein [Halocatena pleomorpha]|uniref:Tripartite tricarboxylate transporter substrate binding protein n=1 Tax=Halocatena pleomorpha TaxID=1785090 RepID=A0A3P3R9A3_9EURY|nr:tripartite tricarboxylate transporter substrate binding protein [Halocatena pleomorpha]RRJ29519.1 tripartite tricarboxylate transporter substrate binding protein [Halocatena pleomorpha]
MPEDTSTEPTRQTVLSRRNLVKAVGTTGLVATAGCLDSVSSQLSGQQSWPSRPVEIISPWAAGGGADRTSRAVADAAENHTEGTWNVSNQTGGSGSVGMNAAANAKPDGHTIGCMAPEIALFEHLGIADLSPDDVTPLMQYTEFPAALVVRKDSKFKSVDNWIAYGQKNTIKMANSGFGSSWHMAAAAIADEAGVKVEHISYDGAAPAMTAVANGEVDSTAVGAAEVASQVKDGNLRALGVAFDEKVKSLPNTPTLANEGLDIRIGSWLAHFAPPDMTESRKQEIVDVYNSVYEDDGFVEFMNNNGFIRVKRSPKELQQFLQEQYEYYGNLVDKLGISKQ